MRWSCSWSLSTIWVPKQWMYFFTRSVWCPNDFVPLRVVCRYVSYNLYVFMFVCFVCMLACYIQTTNTQLAHNMLSLSFSLPLCMIQNVPTPQYSVLILIIPPLVLIVVRYILFDHILLILFSSLILIYCYSFISSYPRRQLWIQYCGYSCQTTIFLIIISPMWIW